jgi:hypothetical protein
MPTMESAVGAFESEYTCQAMAIRKTPSPRSDAAWPAQSTPKSRRRSGASRFTQLAPPARSSAS